MLTLPVLITIVRFVASHALRVHASMELMLGSLFCAKEWAQSRIRNMRNECEQVNNSEQFIN